MDSYIIAQQAFFRSANLSPHGQSMQSMHTTGCPPSCPAVSSCACGVQGCSSVPTEGSFGVDVWKLSRVQNWEGCFAQCGTDVASLNAAGLGSVQSCDRKMLRTSGVQFAESELIISKTTLRCLATGRK